ncbi:hypothetical protein [Aeromonas enterica]
MNDHEGISKGTGYSITKKSRITLMSGGISAVRGEKNRREREAPQSGIQMLFVVFVFIAKHGHILCPSPLVGKPAGVTCFKLLFDL